MLIVCPLRPLRPAVILNILYVTQRIVCEIDIVTRVDGEGYAIPFPETEVAISQVFVSLLRQQIVENRTRSQHGDIDITESLGVAYITTEAKDLTYLLRPA